jgi:hypothetical protein
MEEISLKLDKEEADTLARFLSLLIINIQINPDPANFKAEDLKRIQEKLDYIIHEVANWCDKGENCPYWARKKAIKAKLEKLN